MSRPRKLTDVEFTDFIYEYRRQPDDRDLEIFFKRVKPYLSLKQYKDRHGVITQEDIEAFAFIAYWKAILVYDREKWSKSVMWVCYLVKQRIVKELKSVDLHSRGQFNSVNNKEDATFDLENMAGEVIDDNIDCSSFYTTDLRGLHRDILKFSKKAALTFELRLAFPNISRTYIARLVGAKRRNGVAKFVDIIQARSKYFLHPDVYNDICSKL